MDELDNKLKNLSNDAKRLLALKLKQKVSNASSNIPVINRIGEDYCLPFSFDQERLWFLYCLDNSDTSYNIFSAWRLTGKINRQALDSSFRQIIERHETLRTTVLKNDSGVFQQVHRNITIPFVFEDIRSLSSIDDIIKKKCQEESKRRFNLETGPLYYITLLQAGDNDSFLLFSMHHIIADHWSMSVFLNELKECYNSFVNNIKPFLPELKIQYGDYAAWQREKLNTHGIESQWDYWKKQLQDKINPLELLTDKPRPPFLSHNGDQVEFHLDNHLSTQLKQLAMNNGLTLSMTILAAFKGLLYRYTQNELVTIGMTMAQRNKLETEKLIGFFVTTLVLSTEIEGSITFSQLLKRTRETFVNAFDSQEIPFVKLVEKFHTNRHTGKNPFFQVSYSFHNKSDVVIELDGLKIEQLNTGAQGAQFDLTLAVSESPNNIEGYFRYSTDLFFHSTIKHMVNAFLMILESVSKNPDIIIDNIYLLNDEDSQSQLKQIYANNSHYQTGKCIHEIFEVQAGIFPSNIAVIFKNQKYSYSELNKQASIIARLLHDAGAGCEKPVIIYLQRSALQIISLLAVLKSGSYYIPIDTKEPIERLKAILEDSNASIVITSKSLAESINIFKVRIIVIDDIDFTSSCQTITAAVKPSNLCYAIYTSGSTGKPKGVAVEHRNLINYIYALKDHICPAPGDCYASVSTLSADLGNTVIFPSLCFGGTLHVIEQDILTNEIAMENYFEKNPVDYLKIVPSHLAALVSLSTKKTLLPRKLLILGGESSSLTWIKKIRDDYPGYRIMNHYGPTETTVGVLTFTLEPTEELPANQCLPIGRPLANNHVYILDKNLSLLPRGCPGEICIGGVQVARGYLSGNGEFILDPFINDGKATFYKTGDKGRFLADNNIEFLGRFDDQVKIRGFRVEPGEINAYILSHNGVESSFVAPIKIKDDYRLRAFIVKNKGFILTAEDLRNFLLSKVPSHMIPSDFVFLENLLLTPNGKPDRKAMLQYSIADQMDDCEKKSRAVPRSPIEEILEGIFSQVLEVEQIGIKDNFFSRGGHSISAMHLISHIKRDFEIELSVKTSFEAPTIAQMAKHIDSSRNEKACKTQLKSSKQKAVSRLNLLQENILSMYKDRDTQAAGFSLARIFSREKNKNLFIYNTIFIMLCDKLPDSNILKDSLLLLTERHEALRTIIHSNNTQEVIHSLTIEELPLVFSKGADTLVEFVIPEAEFNFLETGKLLWRFSIAENPSPFLCLSLCPLLSDTFTPLILFEELTEIFDSLLDNKKPDLPSITLQYGDYLDWLSNAIDQEELIKHENFWQERLKGVKQLLKLPRSFTRSSEDSLNKRIYKFIINKEITSLLKKSSRENGMPLSIFMLCIFKIALNYCLHENSLLVVIPITGRDQEGLENMAGRISNFIPIRSEISGFMLINNYMSQVRNMVLDSFLHRFLPFESLVHSLSNNSKDQPSFCPIFFHFDHSPVHPMKMGNVMLEPSIIGRYTWFDLGLTASSIGDELSCEFIYAGNLFNTQDIERLSNDFMKICNNIPYFTSLQVTDLLNKIKTMDTEGV